jgi:hypothetical protein
MVALPSAVIFVNADLTDQVRNHLVKQLHIDEIIDGYTFDQRLVVNPQYVQDLKLLNLRLMVVRPFTELDNRSAADVVIFVKEGMASVLKNNFGPPGLTFKVLSLYWGQLCIFKTQF